MPTESTTTTRPRPQPTKRTTPRPRSGGLADFGAAAERAVIYARISRDKGHDAAGVNRQVSRMLDHAKARGYSVVGSYIDNDASGSDRTKRPEFERMLREVPAFGVTVILAFNVDRLARGHWNLGRIIDTCEAANARVETMLGGDLDLGTAQGRAYARILGAMAQQEREVTAERIRDDKLKRAEEGWWHGGPAPYGYRVDSPEGTRESTLIVNEEEAERIRYLAQCVIDGRTLKSLERELNRIGGPEAPRGEAGTWRYSTIRNMLVSPTINGKRHYRRSGVTYEAGWDAILDDETYEAVRAILLAPERKVRRSASRYLLTGFLVGPDGKPAQATQIRSRNAPKGQTRDGYRATGSVMPASVVDDAATEALFAMVESGGLLVPEEETANAPRNALMAELANVDRRLAKLSEERAMLADSDAPMTDAEWMAQRTPLAKEAKRLKDALANLESIPTRAIRALADPKGLREWWAKHDDLDERREMLSMLVDRVVMFPRGHDPRVVVLPNSRFIAPDATEPDYGHGF